MLKIPMWDVKEPTHYSKRAGREVPGVVAVFLSSKMWPAGRDVSKKAFGVIEDTYAKTATSQKGILPSARYVDVDDENVVFPAEHWLHAPFCLLINSLDCVGVM